jgi:hypothetical protein
MTDKEKKDFHLFDFFGRLLPQEAVRKAGLTSGFASLRFFTITTRRDGKGTEPFASLPHISFDNHPITIGRECSYLFAAFHLL